MINPNSLNPRDKNNDPKLKIDSLTPLSLISLNTQEQKNEGFGLVIEKFHN